MTWLIVFVGIIAFSNLILLVGLGLLGLSLKRLVDKSVTPAIREVNTTLRKVEGMVDKIDNRAERIMDIGENTVKRVSGSVVATSDVVENAVASPFITLSSLMTGINRALNIWRQRTAATTGESVTITTTTT